MPSATASAEPVLLNHARNSLRGEIMCGERRAPALADAARTNSETLGPSEALM
jgi:hypothetical protein